MFGRSNVLPCLSQSKFISADALLRHRGNAQLQSQETLHKVTDPGCCDRSHYPTF